MNFPYSNKKAFTMIELVFVIVIIGILSAIAIPKFAATRDDAIIAKARATVASVRSALATERQKRILQGDFNSTLSAPTGTDIFTIKMSGTEIKLLTYDVTHCAASGKSSCWERGGSAGQFTFYDPSGNSCTFVASSGRLDTGTCAVSGLSTL